MTYRSALASAVLLTTVFATSAAQAAVIVVGTADSNNAIPFDGSFPTTTYQQVYGSSSFSSSIGIADLIFYDTRGSSSDTSPTGTFTIALSTTSVAVGSLSTTFSNNIGPDNTQVFSGSLPALTGTPLELIIPLTSTFNYDPTKGNLLITMNIVGPAGGFLADSHTVNTGNPFSRAASWVLGTFADSAGLVTGFETGAAAVVPIPTALPLFATGLAGLGLLGWRRKKKAAA